MQKTICFGALLLAALFFSGCAAVESITASTREKTLAAGSDTWGGGGEVSTATADNPVPSASFWFGRRKAWYVSVKNASTGHAAAEIVRASNTALSVSAGADGLTASNDNNQSAAADANQ